MPELTLRGRQVGYEAQPEDFDKTSLTVVFVHPSGGDAMDWKAQLEGLTHAANVVALDLPGHGNTPLPWETSVGVYADWVVDFIETLGLERVVVAGCSLGGAIVQWIAIEPKPWLVAIGLVGTGARLRVLPAILDACLNDVEKASEMISDFALSSTASEALRMETKEKFLKCPPGLVHADLSACNDFDVIDKLSEISVPAMILVGEEDRLTPVKYSQFLNEKIADSRLEVIPKAGHMVMVEQPEQFNRLLGDFLSGLKS
jgi:pimeloyl-ACP methyl ester carboxylesterase